MTLVLFVFVDRYKLPTTISFPWTQLPLNIEQLNKRLPFSFFVIKIKIFSTFCIFTALKTSFVKLVDWGTWGSQFYLWLSIRTLLDSSLSLTAVIQRPVKIYSASFLKAFTWSIAKSSWIPYTFVTLQVICLLFPVVNLTVSWSCFFAIQRSRFGIRFEFIWFAGFSIFSFQPILVTI